LLSDCVEGWYASVILVQCSIKTQHTHSKPFTYRRNRFTVYYTSTVLYFTTLRYAILYIVYSLFGRIRDRNVYTKCALPYTWFWLFFCKTVNCIC